MKKYTRMTILTALMLMFGSIGTVHAEIIPPFGEGQIGLQAVVLCSSLTVWQEPSASSKAVQSLKYRDLINVTKQSDGWAYCVLGDSDDSVSGWVIADYIVVDPAWYRTETATPVYAWNDTSAPKVALLDANTAFLDPDTFLPILKDEGEWLVVSLRGAAGWIHKQNSTAETAVPAANPETGEKTGRQNGERFEEVIILEGMEETVRYEHVRNDMIGFEMDYDYESFVRRSEPERECFVSIYDNPANPENYLEVTRSRENAEAVAASVCEALSKDYDIIRESYMLDRAGSCIRIDASAAKGNKGTPDLLQMVYIIPAANGCCIATAHYSFESAEGFGMRFSYIVNTLSVIGR